MNIFYEDEPRNLPAEDKLAIKKALGIFQRTWERNPLPSVVVEKIGVHFMQCPEHSSNVHPYSPIFTVTLEYQRGKANAERIESCLGQQGNDRICFDTEPRKCPEWIATRLRETIVADIEADTFIVLSSVTEQRATAT